jgi:hypothetical protein
MTILVIIAVKMTSCSLLDRDPSGTSEQTSGLGLDIANDRDSMIATREMPALAWIGGNAM